jgi:hypothetical protein
MTTYLDIAALNDPQRMIDELNANGIPGLVFDQYDVTDPGRMLRKIDAAFPGASILDVQSATDVPVTAIPRINAVLALPT